MSNSDLGHSISVAEATAIMQMAPQASGDDASFVTIQPMARVPDGLRELVVFERSDGKLWGFQHIRPWADGVDEWDSDPVLVTRVAKTRDGYKVVAEAEVFSRPECVWNYCPNPDGCQQGCTHARV